MDINFKVKGQWLVRSDCKVVAENSINYLYAAFELDDDWEGLGVKAVFEYMGNSYYAVVSDGRCAVPSDVIRCGGFSVSLIGVGGDGDVRITSSRFKVPVVQGPALEARNASTPTLSELEQIESSVQSLKDRLDNISTVTGECDPTVPDWAKAENKPAYTAEEVGARADTWLPTPNEIGAMPYTDFDTLINSYMNGHNVDESAHGDIRRSITDKINTALAEAKERGEFDGKDGVDGTDGQDGASAYDLYRQLGGTLTESRWIESLNGKDGKDGTVQIEPLFAESVDWLKENGDTTKVYILPDNFIYAYFYKEGTGPAYKNWLPLSTESDRGTIYNNGAGYKDAIRLNSSGVEKDCAGMQATGFIPVKYGDIIRIKNFEHSTTTYTQEICFYGSGDTFLGYSGGTKNTFESGLAGVTVGENGTLLTIDTTAITQASKIPDCQSFRCCFGKLENAIITVNEEITEGGSTGGYDWYSTGNAFVPADYEDRINELEDRIDNININSASGDIDLDYIRNWDTGIYDANVPVFTISADRNKSAISSSELNPTSLYAKYDALMAAYPRYITRTEHTEKSTYNNIPLYRYDIKTPDTDHTGSLFSEQKPKAIIMSGIHQEPSCAYGLFYAIEEIVSNPELRHFRDNVHLIVIPCANPCAFDTADINNVYLNGNGVEIHRNFEVAFVPYDTPGGVQYSGTAPLTEPEAVFIDNIFKANKDSAFVLSCHTFNNASGKDVMWASCGTKYTCNLACRLIQKMSASFIDRFGGELVGIDESNPTMGWVSISGTGGSEYRQATKYGIQGFNLEVSETFAPHDTTKRTAFAMTRYAEVYANMLLTAFGVYDYKDKDKYCRYVK